jgi:hypothetical protein
MTSACIIHIDVCYVGIRFFCFCSASENDGNAAVKKTIETCLNVLSISKFEFLKQLNIIKVHEEKHEMRNEESKSPVLLLKKIFLCTKNSLET